MFRSQPPQKSLSSAAIRGFSLMEMAIVLMIIGTLMSGVLVAVSQSTENTRRVTARAQLRQIEEALYGFAQSYGRLPCPAIANGTGQESPVGGGVCTDWHGFVPSTTLGIFGAVNDDGLLVDPWQNPVRYSVSSYPSTANPTFTSVTNLKALFTNSISTLPNIHLDASMICVSTAINCSGTTKPTETAPALVFSMGADWATYTSTLEQENASGALLGSYPVKSVGDVDFVSTDYAEDVFDDQLVWLSIQVLFARMTAAGKLP